MKRRFQRHGGPDVDTFEAPFSYENCVAELSRRLHNVEQRVKQDANDAVVGTWRRPEMEAASRAISRRNGSPLLHDGLKSPQAKNTPTDIRRPV